MEARITEDEFLCPVCLDLLKDPVTTSCGHSFCWSCIRECWNQQDESEIYSCPQCRETFYQRPALSKNTILAKMLEKLKIKPSADHHAGDGDVPCDACRKRKYEAVKSCVECQESYCLSHLERHEEFHSRKRHRMIEATDGLPLEDQQCVDEPMIHDSVSAQRTETQKKLMETQKALQQKIQQQEKDLQQLRDSVESHERSALKAVEETEKIFNEMIQTMQRRLDEVKEQIRDQEETAVGEAEEIMEKLQKEINDLKIKDEEIEELLQTPDDISLIQSSPSLSALPESADVHFTSLFSFDDVTQSVHQLRNKLEAFCIIVMMKINDRVTVQVDNIDLWSRRNILLYSHQFTLDLNTMSDNLLLSEGNTVTYTDTFQSYPDHPDRFQYVPQVLCEESVSGRCYWELEWTGLCVYISVSYKSIGRKRLRDDCCFGCNNQSWSLFCFSSGFVFKHNNIKTHLSVSSSSRRVGVFVDHDAGTLSFYSVSDTMTLIHRVQTTFTQPLCPGVLVGRSSSVKVCDMSE